MDKALNYMSLARKAGRIELGEEPVGAAARAHHARLVIVASDAGDHTWRKAKSLIAGTEQLCIKVPFTKDQLGQTIGRTSLALAAFTDPALALAFVKALDNADAEVIQQLQARTQRIAKRQKETKAHRRNPRSGTKRNP